MDFDLREAIRRMPIWYKYAEGTAEAYISARLKANTWTAYQYAWDAIATAAASSNIKSWSQFDKEKNFVMSTLAMDGNLKAIVKNNVKATLAIVVDLITKEEEVVNALLKHLKTPVAQRPKRKYEEEQWAHLEPIWDWLKLTFGASDPMVIRNRAIILLKLDTARRQSDIARMFRQYVEWDVSRNGMLGMCVRVACSKESKERSLGNKIFIPEYCDKRICTVTALRQYFNITAHAKPLTIKVVSVICGGIWTREETPLFIWMDNNVPKALKHNTISTICVKILTECGFKLENQQGDPSAHVTRGSAGSFMMSAGASRQSVLSHMGVSEKTFKKFYDRPLPAGHFSGMTTLLVGAHPCFWLRRQETHNLVVNGHKAVRLGQSAVDWSAMANCNAVLS